MFLWVFNPLKVKQEQQMIEKDHLVHFLYDTVSMHSIPVPKSLLTSAGCAVALLGEEAISLKAPCLVVDEKAQGRLSAVANMPS